MRSVAALLLLVALAACNQMTTGEDGYEFQRKEFTHLDPTIRFVEHSSLADLQQSAPALTRTEAARNHKPLGAWSTLDKATKQVCVVHIVDPAVEYMPEMIGHEIAHCIHGRWHD